MPIAVRGRRPRSRSGSRTPSPAVSPASSRNSSPSGSFRNSLMGSGHEALCNTGSGSFSGASPSGSWQEAPAPRRDAAAEPAIDSPLQDSPTPAAEESPTPAAEESFARSFERQISPKTPKNAPRIEERSFAFPHAIGPFTMLLAKLAGKFNEFYDRNKVPRPNPGDSEPSMIGMTLPGISRDIILQLSPLHHITLSDEAREITGIPKEASHFAWAYPMVRRAAASFGSESTDEGAFLAFGGFVYFDERGNAVRAKTLAPARPGIPGALNFGRPQQLPSAVNSALVDQKRFWEVTNAEYAKAGATHFAWIRPGEFDASVACTDGGFAYKFGNGTSIYFPMLQKQGAADPGFKPLCNREGFDQLTSISELSLLEPTHTQGPDVPVVDGGRGRSSSGRWWQCMQSGRR